MCCDFYAVGKSVNIEFLHEQLWFGAEYGKLEVEVFVDVLVRNLSPDDINLIRIQFPHFLGPTEVTVLSTHDVLSNANDAANSRFSWIGDYDYNKVTRQLRLKNLFFDDVASRTSTPGSSKFEYADIMFGAFPPTGITPTGVSTTFLHEMKAVDLCSLDLQLGQPLRPGRCGWLRLRLSPKSWPRRSDVVSTEASNPLGEGSRFKAQFSIISPVDLRDRLVQALAENSVCGDAVVNQGWRCQGTLTRIVDHRISLVLPEHVEVSHVLMNPPTGIVAFGPERYKQLGDRYLLHFATGSLHNLGRDLVTLGERILDYCDFLGNAPPAKDHLVTRFGAGHHEVIGTLVTEMLRVQLLHHVENERVVAVPKSERATRLMHLQRRYSFPQEPIPQFIFALRDLHRFSISLSLSWIAFSDVQKRRSELVSTFIDSLESLFPTAGCRRQALIIANSDYPPAIGASLPIVKKIANSLGDALKQSGFVDRADVEHNVENGDRKLSLIRAKLSSLKKDDEFLLWYIGHAQPSKGRGKELELLPTQSSSGLQWSGISDLFAEYPTIKKGVVLDCCNAGLATDLALPEQTCIWPTTDRNHPAEAGILGQLDPVGKSQNFSWIVAELTNLQ